MWVSLTVCDVRKTSQIMGLSLELVLARWKQIFRLLVILSSSGKRPHSIKKAKRKDINFCAISVFALLQLKHHTNGTCRSPKLVFAYLQSY
jgi:hypothetical protein